MHARHIAILLGLFSALVSPALAQDEKTAWYAGVGLGRLNTRFQPDYTFVLGGDPQQFDNKADGLQVDLIAGRRHRLNDRFSLAYQGAVGINGFKWSLSIPSEPADLRYSLPYTVIASAIPEVHVRGIVSVFGEPGAGLGRVREIKTSPSSSAYDYDALRGALTVGAGLRVKVYPKADVFAQYRQVRYARFGYDTFNSAGVHIEHVEDAPRANGFSFGVTTRF